jgi:hypothetical protein
MLGMSDHSDHRGSAASPVSSRKAPYLRREERIGEHFKPPTERDRLGLDRNR